MNINQALSGVYFGLTAIYLFFIRTLTLKLSLPNEQRKHAVDVMLEYFWITQQGQKHKADDEPAFNLQDRM